MTKQRIKLSPHEELFAQQCRALKLPVVREFRFHATRRWRADFAIPDRMILIEIEGGVWLHKSRHQTGTGFSADCEKYSTAALLGYRVFRFTPAMVKSGAGARMIEEALRDQG